jgi:Recombination endonuclease VII
MKKCIGCGETKDLSLFAVVKKNKDGHSGKCKQCIHERWKAWYESNAEAKKNNAEANKKYYNSELGQQRAFEKRLKKYNLTEQQYQDLFEVSNGLCQICKEENATDIDHNHQTGEVRGLLCPKCNKALGGFKDDPELLKSAIEYLNISGRIPSL